MLGNRIKILREELSLKQEDLARKISVSPSAIGMYERNLREPNNEITLKLADFFNVSVDYLLGKTDIRNNVNNIDNTNDKHYYFCPVYRSNISRTTKLG